MIQQIFVKPHIVLSRDSYLSIRIPVGPLTYRLVSGGWLPRKGLL